MSHTTLILYHHASMSTLYTSLISRALWLPHGGLECSWNNYNIGPTSVQRKLLNCESNDRAAFLIGQLNNQMPMERGFPFKMLGMDQLRFYMYEVKGQCVGSSSVLVGGF